MPMPLYSVSVPFTGYIVVEVEAATQVEAKNIAFDSNFCISLSSDENVSLGALETCEHIVQGNVFYGVQCSIDVERI